MTQTTFEAVREFVASHEKLPLEKLQPDTRLLHDLGLDGDDAFELLTDFAKRFEVDWSATPFSELFDESTAGMRSITRLVGGPEGS